MQQLVCHTSAGILIAGTIYNAEISKAANGSITAVIVNDGSFTTFPNAHQYFVFSPPEEVLAEMIKRISRLAADELAEDENEDFCVNDYAGGNMDDAYNMGIDAGYTHFARELQTLLKPKKMFDDYIYG